MIFETAERFLIARAESLRQRPAALIFAEDSTELGSTLSHLARLGFGTLAVFCDDLVEWPADAPRQACRIRHDIFRDNALTEAVNTVIAGAPGAWLHYCYNGEYLFYPFCETRSIADLTTFQSEERRNSVFTPVIDLYAADLTLFPNGVSRDTARIDAIGYHAVPREDPLNGWSPKERQIDLYGGLRWRFEEHLPWTRRRIDRVGLFRAVPGLQLLSDHRFNDDDFNTVSCAWHHNLTAAVCSFRTAKALRSNPGSARAIRQFSWRHSLPFTWSSRQLLDLGLIEPGQWF